MSVKSVLETLVVRIVGDASSYQRTMHGLAGTAQRSFNRVNRAVIRASTPMERMFDRFAMGIVNLEKRTRIGARIVGGLTDSFQASGRMAIWAGRQWKNAFSFTRGFGRGALGLSLLSGAGGGRAGTLGRGAGGLARSLFMSTSIPHIARGGRRAASLAALMASSGFWGGLGRGALGIRMSRGGGGGIPAMAGRRFGGMAAPMVAGMMGRWSGFRSGVSAMGSRAAMMAHPGFWGGLGRGALGMRMMQGGGGGFAGTYGRHLGGRLRGGGIAALAAAGGLARGAGSRVAAGLGIPKVGGAYTAAGGGMRGLGAATAVVGGGLARGAGAAGRIVGPALRAGGGMALRGAGAGLRMGGMGMMATVGMMARQAPVLGAQLGKIFTGLIPNIGKASAAATAWYTRMRRQIRALGFDMTYLGGRFMWFITVPLAGLGLAVTVAFAKFDDAIKTSSALLETVSPAIEKAMETEAFRISATSRTGPTDVALSYFHLASAGYEAAEAIGAVSKVEKFAIAGAFDLNESGHSAGNSLYAMGKATTYLVDTMAALNLRSSDVNKNLEMMTYVSDVLTKANMIANAKVEDFAQSLTNKGGAALRLLNKDMTEGVAVLATYAAQGVKGAAAGEKLYIILRDTQRAAIKKSAAWDKLGVSVFDSSGKMLHIADIIEQLETKMASMSDEQKRITFLQLGFQDRSLAATMQLLGMSKAIRQYEKQLESAGGTTEMVANRRLASFTSQIMMTRNQITIAAIQLGQIFEPSLMRVNAAVREALTWWNGLEAATKKWVAMALTAVAAIGPMLLGFGILIRLLGITGAGLKVVGMVAGVLFSIPALKIGLVIAAIAGLVYMIAGKEGIVGAWQYAVAAVQNFATNAIGFMENFSENMTILWDWFRNNWKTILVDAGAMVLVFASNMILNFDTAAKTIIRMMSAVIGWVVGQWERGFDTEFGNWAYKGIQRVSIAFFKFAVHMQKMLAKIWSGEGIGVGESIDFATMLKKDLERGATTGSLEGLMKQIGEIFEEGWAKMRTPLAGMVFTTPEGPAFKFGIAEKMKDEVIDPVAKAATIVEDLHDEFDEPFTARFQVTGVDAVVAGSRKFFELMMNSGAVAGGKSTPQQIRADLVRANRLSKGSGLVWPDRFKGPPLMGIEDIPAAADMEGMSAITGLEKRDATKGDFGRIIDEEEALKNIDKNIAEMLDREKRTKPFVLFPADVAGGE